MRRFLKILMLVLALIIRCAGNCDAQKPKTDQAELIHKSLNELKIADSSLCHILDSLIAKEKQCPHFNNDLVWSINFYQLKNEACMLSIEVSTYVDDNTGFYGYFNRAGLTFLVSGKYIPLELVSQMDHLTNLKFDPKKNIRINDYIAWLYRYENHKLILERANDSCE